MFSSSLLGLGDCEFDYHFFFSYYFFLPYVLLGASPCFPTVIPFISSLARSYIVAYPTSLRLFITRYNDKYKYTIYYANLISHGDPVSLPLSSTPSPFLYPPPAIEVPPRPICPLSITPLSIIIDTYDAFHCRADFLVFLGML